MKFRIILTALAFLAGTSLYSQSNFENQHVMFINKDGLAITNLRDVTSGAGLYLHAKDADVPDRSGL